MRHRIKGRKLKRRNAHLILLLRNLANDLIKHESIETTVAKAKEVRRFVERIIEIGKKYEPQNTKSPQSMNSARRVFSMLQNEENTKKVLTNLAQRYKDKNGGYVRVVRIGNRRGDGAEMAVISLV